MTNHDQATTEGMPEPVQDPGLSTERVQDGIMDNQPEPPQEAEVLPCVIVVGCHPASRCKVQVFVQPNDGSTMQLALSLKPGQQATAQIPVNADVVLGRGPEVPRGTLIVDPQGRVLV